MSFKLRKAVPGQYGAILPINEAGFSLTLLILILPIVVSMIAWLTTQVLRMSQVQKMQSICHTPLIRGQESAADKISSLLRLNSLAQSLRSQMIAAKSSLAVALASGNGPGIAAARTWIQRVNLQKDILIQRQRSLILLGHSDLHQSLLDIQKQLTKINRNQPQKPTTLTIQISSISLPKVRLAIRKSNNPDPFPEYELVQRFPRKQALVLKWQGHFQQTKMGFIKWIPKIKQEIQCGVSLRERNGHFSAFPITGKF